MKRSTHRVTQTDFTTQKTSSMKWNAISSKCHLAIPWAQNDKLRSLKNLFFINYMISTFIILIYGHNPFKKTIDFPSKIIKFTTKTKGKSQPVHQGLFKYCDSIRLSYMNGTIYIICTTIRLLNFVDLLVVSVRVWKVNPLQILQSLKHISDDYTYIRPIHSVVRSSIPYMYIK